VVGAGAKFSVDRYHTLIIEVEEDGRD